MHHTSVPPILQAYPSHAYRTVYTTTHPTYTQLAEKRRMGREHERDEDVAFEGLITVREMTGILINSEYLILTRVQASPIPTYGPI